MDFSEDFNPRWDKKKVKFNHHVLIPNNFRCIVVGGSDSGKTFRVFNMVLKDGFLDYDTLHIYSPTLYQDEYKLLVAGLKNKLSKKDIVACFRNQQFLDEEPEIVAQKYAGVMNDSEKWHDVRVYTYGPESSSESLNEKATSSSCLPNPDDLERGRKHLIIFDDCMTGPQKQIENYFTRGRHNNCNVIYIAQNWFELPNKTIRGNCNLILLFPSMPQDLLKRFYNEVMTCNYTYWQVDRNNKKKELLLTKEAFVSYCFSVWREDYHYVTVNREKKIVL